MTVGIIIHGFRRGSFGGFWYDELGVLGGIAFMNLVLQIGRVTHKPGQLSATLQLLRHGPVRTWTWREWRLVVLTVVIGSYVLAFVLSKM